MAICTSQAKLAATYQILQTAESEVAAEKVKTANLRKERNAAQADTVTLQAQASDTSSLLHKRAQWMLTASLESLVT